jgi:hypothetical protein
MGYKEYVEIFRKCKLETLELLQPIDYVIVFEVGFGLMVCEAFRGLQPPMA